MNSKECSQTQPKPFSTPIVIRVIQLGNAPSFKNSRALHGLKKIGPNLWQGTPRLGTDPQKAEWMKRAIRAIELELRSAILDREPTATEQRLRLLTVSLSPLDDSPAWIKSVEWEVEKVRKGEEYFEIKIERIE